MEEKSSLKVFECLKFSYHEDGNSAKLLMISNKIDKYVAFKFHGTALKNYSIQPNMGVIEPGSLCEVVITMKRRWLKDPFKTLLALPTKLQKDRFRHLRESMVVSEAANVKSFNTVEDCDSKLVYLPLSQTPLQVTEEVVSELNPSPVSKEGDDFISSTFTNPSPASEELISECNSLPPVPKEEMEDRALRQSLQLKALNHEGNSNESYIASYMGNYFYYMWNWMLGNLEKLRMGSYFYYMWNWMLGNLEKLRMAESQRRCSENLSACSAVPQADKQTSCGAVNLGTQLCGELGA